MASFVYKTAVNLAIIFILTQCYINSIEANPVEIKVGRPSASSVSTLQSGARKVPPIRAIEVFGNDGGPLVAANAEFRPVFAYKQQQAQRQRVYNRNQPVRRKFISYSYPYGYPSYGYPYYKPVQKKPCKKKEKLEFPALF